MPRYDPGIAPAVRELNRVPGVRTCASCQGKSAPGERSTHADLAYVAFHDPLPIAFEDALLGTIGDIARLEPSSIYSRWPERNAELCTRLADGTRTILGERSTQRWREWTVRLVDAVRAVAPWLRGDSRDALCWCFTCGRLGSIAEHHSTCSAIVLLGADPGRELAAFEGFLAADPNPPDPRLREREGDRKIRARVERGDFGETYRGDWRRFVVDRASEVLRVEVRERLMDRRRGGDPVDYYFDRSRVVFARREA